MRRLDWRSVGMVTSSVNRGSAALVPGTTPRRGATFGMGGATGGAAARLVRRRTRTFRPNYLSFAGTYQCNLACPHCCVPIEWPDRLDIAAATRFLEQARAFGIEVLGFTGGEPFIYPEFLFALCRRGAELGFRFDKVMTNGVWYDDEAHLRRVLRMLARAGCTGKLGLCLDEFHGTQHAERLAVFCRTARRVFDRDTIV